MDTNNSLPKKNIRKLINVVSIVIPVVVAALFGVKLKGYDTSFLPSFYATINGITAVLLVLALIFIKQKKRKAHERTIQVCMLLSLIFLACYVTYHMTSESTKYGGNIGIVYYPLLITHILLSIVVVPLVLYSYLHAWEGNFEKHKKWTKIAWPIWFYVAVSGVVVYLMISPFYSH
jgi:putative membrane protein